MAPARALVAISGAVVAGLLVTRLFLSSSTECARRRLLIAVSPKHLLILLVLLSDEPHTTVGSSVSLLAITRSLINGRKRLPSRYWPVVGGTFLQTGHAQVHILTVLQLQSLQMSCCPSVQA